MLTIAAAPAEESTLMVAVTTPWDPSEFAYYGQHALITQMATILEASIASEQQELCDKLSAVAGRGMRGLYHTVGTAENLEALNAFVAENAELAVAGETDFKSFAPSVTTIRGFTMRTQNCSFAWWLQGCWVVGRSGELVATSVSLPKILEKVSMSSVDGFETAMADRKISRLEWPCCVIRPGECAYFPFGEAPLVTSTSELASFLVIPWISKIGLLAQTDVQELVFAGFGNFLGKVGGKAPWKAVVPLWKKYRASLIAD